MCGINLIIDKRSNIDERYIIRMNSITRHRGPDATNFIKSRFPDSLQQTIYIGNNRLKIIDKSDLANQPFISPCGKYIISFNGEIYNYLELKKNLINLVIGWVVGWLWLNSLSDHTKYSGRRQAALLGG